MENLITSIILGGIAGGIIGSAVALVVIATLEKLRR